MRRDHAHANERHAPKPLDDQTEGLGLFAHAERAAHAAVDVEAEQTARDVALSVHRSKSDLMKALRAAAVKEYERAPRPISVNDIRHALPKDENKKVLGVVFQDRYWTRVGSTETTCPGATKDRVGANRGGISTYEPTHVVKMRAEKAEDRGAA